VRDAAVTHERSFAWGNITISLGYSDVDSVGPVAVEAACGIRELAPRIR